MNNQMSQTQGQSDPLAQLRDIHLPEPISWWPPAPGWWLLTMIMLVALFFTIQWLIKRRANNCYRREAIEQLKQIQVASINNLERCQALLTLLRCTAKTAYPELALESELTPTLLSRLNQCCSQEVFDPKLQQQLSQLPYQASPEISEALLQQLQQATKQWLKKHNKKTVASTAKNSVRGKPKC